MNLVKSFERWDAIDTARRRICSLGFQPSRRKFYTKLPLTINRVETDDKKWGTTYQLLWVRVRVRVRVFCRVRVRVRVSVSCRTGGSFLKDKGISLLSEGKIRVNK